MLALPTVFLVVVSCCSMFSYVRGYTIGCDCQILAMYRFQREQQRLVAIIQLHHKSTKSLRLHRRRVQSIAPYAASANHHEHITASPAVAA